MVDRIFTRAPYYMAILGIIVLYFFQEKKVLNFPISINIVIFSISFIFIQYLINRYDSRKKEDIEYVQEKIEKNKDINVFSAPILNLLGVAILAFTVLCAVKAPFIYYIEQAAQENPIIVKKVNIDNVKLRNISTLYVQFEGEIESLEGLGNYKGKMDKEELINNYAILLSYRESILGTAVWDDYRLVKKDADIIENGFLKSR